MNRLGLGNIVAAEMDKIMGSKEHAQMFSKAEKACKCPEDCGCKGDCSGSCEACSKSKKDEKMSAESFEEIVATLISVSDTLDSLGFRKSAIATLEVVDKTYLEVEKLLSTAEDLAHQEAGPGDLDLEDLDQDLGDLGDLEAMLASEDLEDANDARLLDELGLRPLEEDPDLEGAFSENLANKERELLQHVGGEGFEEENEDNTDIDELLGNSLRSTDLATSEDVPSRLPPPAKVPPSEEELLRGKVDPEYMYGDLLQDPSVNMSAARTGVSGDRDMKTLAPEVKQAFEKLDLWIAKHAHEDEDMEDLESGFTYGPSDGDEKIRLPGGEMVSFDDLSPADRLDQEMGAGLNEQLDIDPDELSYQDIVPDEDEDYFEDLIRDQGDDADDCMYEDSADADDFEDE